MKKFVFVFAMVVLTLALMLNQQPALAQQPVGTPINPTPAVTPIPGSMNNPAFETRLGEIDRRISDLEVRLQVTIRGLEVSNENTRLLLAIVGGFAALITISAFVQTFIQYRRDSEQDKSDRESAKRVNDILDVVDRTLESRLEAEKEADKARAALAANEKRLKNLESFQDQLENVKKKRREKIEEMAKSIVQTPRRNFKTISQELVDFSKRFDNFQDDYGDDLQESLVDVRSIHVRGVSAIYTNRPDEVEKFLNQVIAFKETLSDEDDIATNKRKAVAYYYLGLNHSNFGEYDLAIPQLESALRLDPSETDFLTRLVTTEVFVMDKRFSRANDLLSAIEEDLRTIERRNSKPLSNHELRYQSRAILIRANILFASRTPQWAEQSIQLLEKVRATDPQYYYALSTLGQLYKESMDGQRSTEAFKCAWQTIARTDQFAGIKEARSRILLLIVSAMCCLHGVNDSQTSASYLERAEQACGDSLPKIGRRVCTVFSPLSKRNEKVETILEHIELIRQGQVLV